MFSNSTAIIGAIIGFTIYRFPGAILGYILGSFFSFLTSTNKPNKANNRQPKTSTSLQFFLNNLLQLASVIIKADGNVQKIEIDYVRKFLTQNFGLETSNKMMLQLKEMLDKQINLDIVASQIRLQMQHEERVQLFHFLYGLAFCDGNVHVHEDTLLNRIGYALGLNAQDIQAIKSMFVATSTSHYDLLEVSVDASPEEIKKAYRTLAVKHHPDKVAHLGEDIQKKSEEKFKLIQEAYEKIKKEKGIN